MRTICLPISRPCSGSKLDVLRAGELGLVEGADDLGVEALGRLGHGRHDALVIDHHHLHRAGDDAQLLHQVVAGHRDALAHQHFIAGAAQPGQVDALGALRLRQRRAARDLARQQRSPRESIGL